MDATNYDAIVAGGGPVGLLLACELRLGGADVAVLERLTEVDTTIKAGAINIPSAQAFDRRGLLSRLAEARERAMDEVRAFLRAQAGAGAAGHGGRPPTMPPKAAGHFAGIRLRGDLLDEADPAFTGIGPAGDNLGMLPQEQIERLLAVRCEELGVDLRRGVEVTGFEADGDGVTVRTAPVAGRPGDAAGDGPGVLRAAWLVGCDGGRSTVRKLGGFDFPGTDPVLTGRQALVEMTGAEQLKPGWNWTDTGTYAYGPLPGRILTAEFDGPPADRDAPVTAEEIASSVRHVTGADVTVTKVLSATRFTDNARQVTDYRAGRVLLAGDAAHVHSPFGGQGLNLGLGDAMNLGWKLASVIRGDAPDGLLDTYTRERHPIGAWVLDWTRAQISLMRPGPHADALRTVVAELADTVTGTTYFAKKISGVLQRYPAADGDHPLVGASAPDLVLADGSRLAEHLHGGRAVLFDLTGDPALTACADGHGARVDTLTVACPSHPELAGLLVRPDGITAWAAGRPGPGDGSADGAEGAGGGSGCGDTERLRTVLERWFGVPAASGA